MLPDVFDMYVLYRICFAVLTIHFLFFSFSLSLSPSLYIRGCRGDRGGCGKHGVLPWRAGQCEHSQHQRPGRPQQPAEHGQRRGLLLLQCQTCLLLLDPYTTNTTTMSFPAKPTCPPIRLSIRPCLCTYTQSPQMAATAPANSSFLFSSAPS